MVFKFVYRIVGAVWICAGVAILLAALPLTEVRSWMSNLIVSSLPSLARAQALPSPQVQFGTDELIATVMVIAFGLFCMFYGIGLLTLRSWARTVGIAFHIAVGVCVAVLTLLVYLRLAPPDQATSRASDVAAVLGLGAVLGLLLVALGLQMSAPAATDAFMGALPALPQPTPVKCPTCGGNLDLAKARCPKCDTELDEPKSPKRARLVDVQSGREYAVSLRKLNRVGREMPGLEIQLENRSVSGNHASIEYHQGHFYLHAHDDTFGTYVNGRGTRESEIKHDDVIKFGQAELRFVVEY